LTEFNAAAREILAYPKFDHQYFMKQMQRITSLRDRIHARGPVSKKGIALPEPGDLPIGQGREFDASVLFLDISKFSARGSDDPAVQAELLVVMSLFFCEMIRVVEDYGGTVEKNTGDGLLAYFVQDGLLSPPPQEVAVEAAVTMFMAGELVNYFVKKLEIEPVNFRICIDHGPITVAELGAARRFRGIVAIGNTANIASKLLGIAEPGQILIGDAVRQALSFPDTLYLGQPLQTGFYYKASGAPYHAYPFTRRHDIPARP
jgi:class 3 adenylate cyclase